MRAKQQIPCNHERDKGKGPGLFVRRQMNVPAPSQKQKSEGPEEATAEGQERKVDPPSLALKAQTMGI